MPEPFVNELDDGALARRIADASPGRDGAAETELCRRLAPRARLYGLRHLRNRAAASDLAQEVMLMTLERIRGGKLREPERLASFVLGMCRFVVIDWKRGEGRRLALLQKYGEDLPVADASREPRLDRELLLDCLQKLSERERAVIVSTFFDDSPSDAVAAEIGISAANVRVIRHRALARLRECMGSKE